MQYSYDTSDNQISSSIAGKLWVGKDKVNSYSINYGYNKLNGKLSKTEISIDHGGSKAMTQLKIKYDDLDRVSRIARPNVIGDVTYGYDIHGWLRNIETKTFKESVYYADGCGKPCYNGNISSMTWQNYGYTQLMGYRFSYDGLEGSHLPNTGRGKDLGTSRTDMTSAWNTTSTETSEDFKGEG